ncbi:collagen alpha-1(I) chain-like [Sorex araneus]|uniref:collagen alpha-1(I) chain-like n=1 Tax=Sorex araneus TaxID=42254 RepID=UPI002433DBE1|nr:collagen alpha-1(I) chain-like [Sorex araneus]
MPPRAAGRRPPRGAVGGAGLGGSGPPRPWITLGAARRGARGSPRAVSGLDPLEVTAGARPGWRPAPGEADGEQATAPGSPGGLLGHPGHPSTRQPAWAGPQERLPAASLPHATPREAPGASGPGARGPFSSEASVFWSGWRTPVLQHIEHSGRTSDTGTVGNSTPPGPGPSSWGDSPLALPTPCISRGCRFSARLREPLG